MKVKEVEIAEKEIKEAEKAIEIAEEKVVGLADRSLKRGDNSLIGAVRDLEKAEHSASEACEATEEAKFKLNKT